MSKKRFVQAVLIRRCPEPGQVAATVAYAERLWDELNRAGYGMDAPGQPREAKDWYASLNTDQRLSFEAFWKAFNLKKGRNEAARRWAQLGILTREQYQEIIQAARAEAQRDLPNGQARKFAQGWLYEMRWLDYATAPVDPERLQKAERQRTAAELLSIRRLFEMSQDPALAAQIERLEIKLKRMRFPDGA